MRIGNTASSLLIALILAAPAQADDWLYLTQPGDTLIGIAQQYLANTKDWPKIQSSNKVGIPKNLPTNTRLKIPVALLKSHPAPVTVTAVGGNVRVKPADGPFRALAQGDQLKGGETVLTGPVGSASFRFADGTQVTQQASSKLTFGRLAVYGKTGMVAAELNLDAGRLEAQAAKQIAPAGGFSVKTPVAVAGLRGTAFRLNVAEDGQRMSNEVTEGAVALGAQGREVKVAGGFGSFTEAGKPPSPPRELLPKPDLTGLPSRLTGFPPTMSWPAQAGAKGWRVQLGTEPELKTVLRDLLTTSPAVVWGDDLPDGRYFVRVRAVDENGLEGFDAQHSFSLDARPLPPRIEQPSQGERQYRTDVELAWSGAPMASGYLLQLSPDPAFKVDVTEQKLDAVTRHQVTLTPGDWYWRMASLNQLGEPRTFGPVQDFKVQPLPTPPSDGSGKAAPGQASFAWSPATGVARYGFELRNNAGAVVAQQEISDSRLSVNELKPGRYSWRVRGVEGDGKTGQWGQEHPLIVPPFPPRLDGPEEGKRHIHPELVLSWLPVEGAQAYRLQVGDKPDLIRPQTEVRLSTNAHIWNIPSPGLWYWRVAALGEGNVSSGYGPARSFRYQPLPARVDNLAFWVEGDQLAASWNGKAEKYRVEFAKDPYFTDLLANEVVSAPQARTAKPPRGKYWLRVTPMDAEGQTGPASEPIRLEVRQSFLEVLLPGLPLFKQEAKASQ